MRLKIKMLFRDDRQYRLFMLLAFATLFDMALVAVRLYHLDIYMVDLHLIEDYSRLRGSITFLFLVWNLFLAWIPYLIALAIEDIYEVGQSKFLAAFALLAWLFFFPNAPYILTDLLHLKSRAPIPHWYDLMLLLSFAWTGMMLGYLSLYEVQRFIGRRSRPLLARLFVGIALPLCAIGVYIGRYRRWNSWDIVTRPGELLQDSFQTLVPPYAETGAIGMIVVFTVFLFLGYQMMVIMISER